MVLYLCCLLFYVRAACVGAALEKTSVLPDGRAAGDPAAADPYPCTIAKIYGDERFSKGVLDTSTLEKPVIFVRNHSTNLPLSHLVGKDALMKAFGDSVVELRSSNSYSSGIIRMTLSDYIEGFITSSQDEMGLANETYYLFGGNTGGLWDTIDDLYVLPGCRFCKKAGAVIPGLGGLMSGVSFHFHGPGFSEVISGAKRWFLYPPPPHAASSSSRNVPGFNPNMTVVQWVSEVYSTFENESGLRPLECVIRPGEVLYFPDRWMHATLNVEHYVFFVSLFLDPQLMAD